MFPLLLAVVLVTLSWVPGTLPQETFSGLCDEHFVVQLIRLCSEPSNPSHRRGKRDVPEIASDLGAIGHDPELGNFSTLLIYTVLPPARASSCHGCQPTPHPIPVSSEL